jgi:hypothetical protein
MIGHNLKKILNFSSLLSRSSSGFNFGTGSFVTSLGSTELGLEACFLTRLGGMELFSKLSD